MFNNRRIKLRIKTEGFKCSFPSIPITLAVQIVNCAIYSAKFSKKYREEYQFIAPIVKSVLKGLREHPPFDLVDVQASDGTIVQITVL